MPNLLLVYGSYGSNVKKKWLAGGATCRLRGARLALGWGTMR